MLLASLREGAWGKLLSWWQKHFSFDQTKYSAGIMHYVESAKHAAGYLRKVLKTFDGSTYIRCVQSTAL